MYLCRSRKSHLRERLLARSPASRTDTAVVPRCSPFFFSSRRRHTRSYGDWVQTCALPISVNEGDVILLDAGDETRTLYTADVTRTFPATGEYTAAQRQVHDLVHKAQLASLDAVKVGAPYRAFQYEAMRVLAEGLRDWGLLDVSIDEL